ncbi:helix-turn-helix transcriptional regulator [Mycobacterium sp. 236(2023)]|uniref:helix-turn-helix domain-containing protein n=1 Tax=Mycobacterium sp. 236(2023) TaxID=3038163 RepID=UPI002414D13C|nr:helix-turn-helix transcriptional regulator [Mycobacterium sp. 236(2023)]MDG4667992.1 helix-turn-helix transcriptional regulator [Mycobacterium sp. 236(2023)]
MTGPHERTLIEEIEATDAGAQGLAAADLAGQANRVLQAALDASELDQKDLAAKLGVSPGRVSQVVNSDGNLRIAAFARYLRALGYEATITARPVESGLPELQTRRAPRGTMRPIGGTVEPGVEATAKCRHAIEDVARVIGVFRSSAFKTFAEINFSTAMPLAFVSTEIFTGGFLHHVVKDHGIEGPSGAADLDAEYAAICRNA